MKIQHKIVKHHFNLLSKFAFFIIALIFTLSSCKVTSKSAYFKTLTKDTTITGFVPNNYESKIVKGDILAITVSSLSTIEDGIFNSGMPVQGGELSGYTVQQDGTVLLHRLGNVQAEGLTRKELAKKIQQGLIAYTKEPIVQVAYVNHKITVVGKIGSPSVLKLPQDQISIIDALVLCGDVTESAKKNDITIIREENGNKVVKHLNLEDNSIFTSPWYYVKPNDLILVTSDISKEIKAERKQKLQNTITLVTTGLSLVLVILSQFVK
jgi:polysaccharide biosynthesis/export protein